MLPSSFCMYQRPALMATPTARPSPGICGCVTAYRVPPRADDQGVKAVLRSFLETAGHERFGYQLMPAQAGRVYQFPYSRRDTRGGGCPCTALAGDTTDHASETRTHPVGDRQSVPTVWSDLCSEGFGSGWRQQTLRAFVSTHHVFGRDGPV